MQRSQNDSYSSDYFSRWFTWMVWSRFLNNDDETYLSCICKPILNLSTRKASLSAEEILIPMGGVRIIHVDIEPNL